MSSCGHGIGAERFCAGRSHILFLQCTSRRNSFYSLERGLALSQKSVLLRETIHLLGQYPGLTLLWDQNLQKCLRQISVNPRSLFKESILLLRKGGGAAPLILLNKVLSSHGVLI